MVLTTQGEEVVDDEGDRTKCQSSRVVSFVSEIDGRPKGSRDRVTMKWVDCAR